MRIPIRLARLGLALMALGAMAAPAAAQAPAANATIGNQAIATYENAVGETIEVRSNLVETTVNQVAGVTVVADQTKNVAIGGKVFFPHTITNNGNGADTYTVGAVDDNGIGDFDITAANISIYPDADTDGVPDTLTPITVTPSIAAGGVYGVVIEVNVPTTVAAGESESITLTATSQTDGTVSDTSQDTIVITGNAIIDLTKSMTPATVSPGDTVTVTLSYQNNGLADATTVTISDALPSGLTYVTNSATWSDAVGTSLTDVDDGAEATNGVNNTLALDFNVTAANTVTAVINSVPAGRSATITFEATVDGGVSGTIANTASFTVANGDPGTSNQAVITVNDSLGVTVADRSASAEGTTDLADTDLDTRVVSATDTDGSDNDIVTEDGTNGTFDADGNSVNDSFPQGGVVPFQFVLTNHSNIPQVFNLSVANDGGQTIGSGTAFPAGTTFSFTDASGVPLTDSDGDGNPDISLSVNAGANEDVGVFTLRADLPETSTDPVTRAITDPAWDATVTVRASDDDTVLNRSVASLTAEVVGAVVDIENAGGLADGSAVTNTGGAPWTEDAVDPGQTASFTIVVENNGPAASSYDLDFSGSNFSASTGLPAGWTVRFLDGSSSVVSNTGLIGSQSSATFTAEVTVPVDAPAGDQDIYFRALSPTNGSSDIKMDRVVVNEVIDVRITPDRSSQAAEGGTVVMSHTITNDSNITITEGAITLAGYSDFAGTLFLDDGNGTLDGADTVIDNFDDINAGAGLAPGQTVTIFNRVQVPANATAGQQETGTITLANALNSNNATDGDPANNVVLDVVTVVSGDLTVIKYQVVDANCTHNGGAGFVAGDFSQTASTADPGDCIRYRITAENTGTADALNVTISDQTPSFTSVEVCAGDICDVFTSGPNAPSVDTNPGDEGTGTLVVSYGALAPGQIAELRFTVQIDE